MAYMNQEKKAIINNLMKPILKKYKVKATLSVSHRSTVHLNIKSGAIDFPLNEQGYTQVNPYYYEEHFASNQDAVAFLTEAHAALKGAGFYNRSDIQSDYFDIAYYYYVNIGQWNKPYQLNA
jgi:hypothetical protein